MRSCGPTRASSNMASVTWSGVVMKGTSSLAWARATPTVPASARLPSTVRSAARRAKSWRAWAGVARRRGVFISSGPSGG